jgi:long-subunit fatty acid transport protein
MLKRIFWNVTLIFLSSIFASFALAASVADTYGLSPKAIGMGNAMTAHVNDWSSVYYNAAGLGRTSHLKENESKNEVFLGYLYTLPQTKLDIPERYVEEDGEVSTYATNADDNLDFGSFVIGAAVDLNMLYKMPTAVSSSRFGLSITVGDDMTVAKINDIEPQTHNYLRLGREIQKMDIITGLGFGFLQDTFGVGFGIRTSFGGEGKVLLEDIQVSTDAQSPKGQTLMDLELDMSCWLAGIYVDLGKVAPPLKGLDIGMAYRSESKFEIDPFNTVGIVQTGGIPLNLHLALFDYYYPATYTLGFSYQLLKNLRLALDLEYQGWSDYEVSSVMGRNYPDMLPDLEDIWVPRLGIQYDKSPRTSIFGGYYFQSSIVPDDAVDGVVNWLDNDRHVFSIGVRRDAGKFAGFQKPLVLNAAYQFQHLVERDVTKTDPTTLNPSYTYGGSVHTIMLGVGF